MAQPDFFHDLPAPELADDLRRLNQAYFAFYGAYADLPQGAAGEDPIGAAVRQLWTATASPSDFLRQMSRMNSVADLELAVSRPLTTP